MANRRAQKPAEPAPFNPRGALPEGNPQVVRLDGSTQRKIASVALSLASEFGRFADEAAAIEGERAGRAAGLDPDFRPTGSVTIRGRSYDQAATQTYLDNLDAALRQDMQRVYEANRERPAELKRAFDVLAQEYRSRHVFPEIAGRFHAQFARLRLPFENKALDDERRRIEDTGRAALVENISQHATTASRLAIGNPSDPATAKAIADEIRAMEGHYDRAAEAGIITQTQAAKLKITARGEITKQAVIAEAEQLDSAEAVETYRQGVRAKFAQGELRTLDADHFEALDNALVQVAQRKRTSGSAAELALARRVDNFVERAVAGVAVPAEEWFTISAEGARSDAGRAIVELGEKKLLIGQKLRTMGIDQAHAVVSRMRAEINKKGGASAAEFDLLQFAEKYVASQARDLGTDMLGLAEKKRVVDAVTPLDLEPFLTAPDPRAVSGPAAEQIAARAAQANAVAQTFQRRPQYFRPAEKERMKEIVAAGGDRPLALAQAIAAGGGDDAINMLAEIGGDAPLLAQAGNILAHGGSVGAARDALEAARLKREKIALPTLDNTQFFSAVRDVLGTAFLLQGEDGGRVRATAQAIAQVRLERGRIDPKDSAAGEIYQRALQEAAGAIFIDGVQYGGIGLYKPGWYTTHRVAVPPGVRADAFRNVLLAIRDDDLRTLAVPPVSQSGETERARKLHAAVPVAVKTDEGLAYRFALGDPLSDDPRYIRGADGQPFVLPWAALAGQLRARVPGAFIGAR